MSEQFAFAYLRVSTNDQTIENQRLQIENFSKRWGIHVRENGWFEDPAVSGTKAPLQRAGFRELLETIQAMKELGETVPACIYVYEISRWGRTFWETLDAIKLLEENSLIISTSDREAFLQTADKNLRHLFFSILAWAAEREREVLVQRVKEGVNRAHSEGKHSGNVPLGFSLERGKLVLDTMGSKVKKRLEWNPKIRPIQIMKELEIADYNSAYKLLRSVKRFSQ